MKAQGFTVWGTGPDEALVRTVMEDVAARLASRHLAIEVLDERTPGIGALTADAVACVAGALGRHGVVSVVALAASGPARERARSALGRMIEVHVCRAGAALPAGYEAPTRAEVEIALPETEPGAGAERVLRTVEVLGLLAREEDRAYSEEEEREVIKRLKAFGYI
jgi:hypothetical protein